MREIWQCMEECEANHSEDFQRMEGDVDHYVTVFGVQLGLIME